MAEFYQDEVPYSDQVIDLEKRCSQTWLNYFLSIQPKAGGQAVFVDGEVTIKTDRVQASSIIMVSRASAGTGQPYQLPADIVPAESFTIKSTDGSDSGAVNWILFT